MILHGYMKNDEAWAIVYKPNNKVIGSISFHKDDMRATVEALNAKQISYDLSEDYWGQGLMTEAVKCVMRYAFEELRADLLAVGHFPFNNRSRRVIEKCGFHLEGTLRYARPMYDGTPCDTVCYSMTKEEWYSDKAGK